MLPQDIVKPEMLIRSLTLFSTNALSNWSIFEDKNGIINVRLRFTKCDETNTVEPASFCRKSDTQMKRDRDRAGRYRNAHAGRITRSQASEQNVDDSLELPRCSEEHFISELAPLDSPVRVQLNSCQIQLQNISNSLKCIIVISASYIYARNVIQKSMA